MCWPRSHTRHGGYPSTDGHAEPRRRWHPRPRADTCKDRPSLGDLPSPPCLIVCRLARAPREGGVYGRQQVSRATISKPAQADDSGCTRAQPARRHPLGACRARCHHARDMRSVSLCRAPYMATPADHRCGPDIPCNFCTAESSRGIHGSGHVQTKQAEVARWRPAIGTDGCGWPRHHEQLRGCRW